MKTLRGAALIVLMCLSGAARGQETVFGWVPVGSRPQAPAVVTFYGSRLFTISLPAGGLSPITRAQVVAARLEALRQAGTLAPGNIAVVDLPGSPDHAVVACAAAAGCASIVTVDPALARSALAGQPDARYLANWWAALLADHLLAAAGRAPVYTAGSPAGQVLALMATRIAGDPKLGFPQVLNTLTRAQWDTLSQASMQVPPRWVPVPLGQAALPAPAPQVAQPAPPQAQPTQAQPSPAAPATAPSWLVERQDNNLVISWQGDPARLQSVQFVLVDQNFDPLQVVTRSEAPFTARFSSPPAGSMIRIWATDASGNETLTLLAVDNVRQVQVPSSQPPLPQPGTVPGQLQTKP